MYGGQLTNVEVDSPPSFTLPKIPLLPVHVLELLEFTVDKVLSWAFDMDTSVCKDAYGNRLSLVPRSATFVLVMRCCSQQNTFPKRFAVHSSVLHDWKKIPTFERSMGGLETIYSTDLRGGE